jgi:hypothetical protein
MWSALPIAGALLFLLAMPMARAQDETATKVSIKGAIQGGEYLLNPVWKEAKDPKNHRFTFRAPSATVGKQAKVLTAYLPKELCIVALGAGEVERGSTPHTVHVSGGRTTPVTIVVPSNQSVQFVNDDPFPHKLFSTAEGHGGFSPEETKPAGQRAWKPPGKGVHEIRDKYFPSLKSWIVVEPRAVATGHPMRTNPKEYVINGLLPGTYELRAYFMGKQVGKSINIDVKPKPEVQTVGNTLVVATKPKG